MPGAEPARIRASVGNIDLLPTLLALADIEADLEIAGVGLPAALDDDRVLLGVAMTNTPRLMATTRAATANSCFIVRRGGEDWSSSI